MPHFAQLTLTKIGKSVAGLWLAIAQLVMLFGFPVSGLVASIAAGLAVEQASGGGFWVVAAVSYAVGMFLAVYVWTPHVRPAMLRAVHCLTRPE
jgi:hypothetical protein